MSKTTDKLLVDARNILSTLDGGTEEALGERAEKIQDRIEALECLGREATANHTEYDELLEAIADFSAEADPPNETAVDSGTEPEPEPEAEAEKPKPKPKIDSKSGGMRYAGIRMIGSSWYSAKDKYQRSFASADECAKFFNGAKDAQN